MSPPERTVLITGCSAGGIGAGLAEVFREKGYHVFPTVRDPSKLSPTLAAAANVTPLTLDVLSAQSITAAVSAVSSRTSGRLDVLINNSGSNFFRPALDVSLEQGRNLFELNFWAPLAMLQAFAPLLIEAQGCIINQSSAAGIYNSSKAALSMASEIWRRELEPLGVRTITLVTTSVRTPAFDKIDKTRLPQTSHYYIINGYIERLTDGRLQEGAPTPRTYAMQVYREFEEGTTGEVWVGKDAGVNRWALRLLLSWLFDMMLDGFLKVSGELTKVAQAEKAARQGR